MAGRGGGSKGGGGDRKLTFKEKSSIKFVEGDEPDFIKKMKAKMGFREAATVEDKFAPEDEEDIPDTVEGELLHTREEERPQIVIVNAETDLGDDDVRKALEAQQRKEDQKKIEEGRITFKKPTKRVADGKTKEEEEAEEKKRKIEKAKQPEKKIERNLLSFGDDEDDE
uniref:DUF4604 domain-containing protein n=1 Tax=Pristionchus pacificus TaxID=54126 RepID=A0A8R1YH35_PRIPA